MGSLVYMVITLLLLTLSIPAQGQISQETATSYPSRILILSDAGAAGSEAQWPLGAGVALREGHVSDPAALTIVDASGQTVPAAFESRGSHWDDGSIKWLWADFEGIPGQDYYLQFDGKRAQPDPAVEVSDEAGRIIVDNGLLKLVWDKQLATPVAVSSAGRLAGSGDGRGACLIDNLGVETAMAGRAAELDLGDRDVEFRAGGAAL